MNNGFDLDRIGRREPYRVPDDFFRNLEESIINETIAPPKRQWMSWRKALASTAAAAAIAAAIVMVCINPVSDGYAIEEVERVFAQLSDTDQEYLLDTYQEDIFINQ